MTEKPNYTLDLVIASILAITVVSGLMALATYAIMATATIP